ncbi:MAG: RnfH family protein [Pseudomonadota bacterium]|nr:RnfH family protein [Pseudomonadota bacterium]
MVVRIEVCYANAEQQWLIPVDIPEGSSVEQAIAASRILTTCSEIATLPLSVGIFSKKCDLQTVLQAGDRVEIYRPLLIDPKAARLLRAQRRK